MKNKIRKAKCPHGYNRGFKIDFQPGTDGTNQLEVGMTFTITSVNRASGAVTFAVDVECPLDLSDEQKDVWFKRP